MIDSRWALCLRAGLGEKGTKNMTKDRKCAHPACNCNAPEGSKYCSQYCHDAGASLELSCNCGHPGCAEELTHRA